MKWFKNAAGATAPTHITNTAAMTAGASFFHRGTGFGSGLATGAAFADDVCCGWAET